MSYLKFKFYIHQGKSTLMGQLLVKLGYVNKKTVYKYEKESKDAGKSSFALAWIMDEGDQERARGLF